MQREALQYFPNEEPARALILHMRNVQVRQRREWQRSATARAIIERRLGREHITEWWARAVRQIEERNWEYEDEEEDDGQGKDAQPAAPAMRTDGDATRVPTAPPPGSRRRVPFAAPPERVITWLSALRREWINNGVSNGTDVTQEPLFLIPAGYTLWGSRRKNGRDIDWYLYGHPRGRRFNSPNNFLFHYLWLLDPEHDQKGHRCRCDLC